MPVLRYDYLWEKICMYRVCIYLLNSVQPLLPPSSSTWLTLVPCNNVSSCISHKIRADI